MSGNLGMHSRPTTHGDRERIRRVVDAAEPAPPLNGVDTESLAPHLQAELMDRLVQENATPLDRYLVAVHDFLTRYCAFSSEHEPVAIALWVAHSYLVERFEVSPILAVTSAEMRSGKTRVLDCLELLCPHPQRMVVPSGAVFYRVLALRPRITVLLDEVDAVFGPRPSERTEGIRAVLNSGNQKGSPVLRVRYDGRSGEVEAFDVYGAKCIAGIGDLPATVADRSILIRMRRRAPDESVVRFRKRTATKEARTITPPDWSGVPLAPDVPDIPEELSDRAMDSWEPLVSIADKAGGLWPVRARTAAAALSSEKDGPGSVGIRLLADIRDAFGDTDHLHTLRLLGLLHAVDGSPWGDWYGSPLSARELAKLLGPYGIGPAQRRVRGEKSRGYFKQDFTDAWRRYLPATGTGTSGASVTPDGPDHAVDGDAHATL